jgi:hypothetical protein
MDSPSRYEADGAKTFARRGVADATPDRPKRIRSRGRALTASTPLFTAFATRSPSLPNSRVGGS